MDCGHRHLRGPRGSRHRPGRRHSGQRRGRSGDLRVPAGRRRAGADPGRGPPRGDRGLSRRGTPADGEHGLRHHPVHDPHADPDAGGHCPEHHPGPDRGGRPQDPDLPRLHRDDPGRRAGWPAGRGRDRVPGQPAVGLRDPAAVPVPARCRVRHRGGGDRPDRGRRRRPRRAATTDRPAGRSARHRRRDHRRRHRRPGVPRLPRLHRHPRPDEPDAHLRQRRSSCSSAGWRSAWWR